MLRYLQLQVGRKDRRDATRWSAYSRVRSFALGIAVSKIFDGTKPQGEQVRPNLALPVHFVSY